MPQSIFRAWLPAGLFLRPYPAEFPVAGARLPPHRRGAVARDQRDLGLIPRPMRAAHQRTSTNSTGLMPGATEWVRPRVLASVEFQPSSGYSAWILSGEVLPFKGSRSAEVPLLDYGRRLSVYQPVSCSNGWPAAPSAEAAARIPAARISWIIPSRRFPSMSLTLRPSAVGSAF